ncbi:hypothetical protein Moror_16604, partial [Moniliophthora roreri MCA 2997]
EKTGDGYMLCGLRTVLSRKWTSEDHTNLNYIETYMAVQYNAVLDIRADGDVYGSSWVGHPTTTLDPVGQINAVTVLVSIMPFNTTITGGGTNTPRSSITSSSSPPKSRNSAKASAVDVVGGVIFLSIIAVALPYTVAEAPNRNEKGVAQITAPAPTSPEPPIPPRPLREDIPTAQPAQLPADPNVGQMNEELSTSDLARL